MWGNPTWRPSLDLSLFPLYFSHYIFLSRKFKVLLRKYSFNSLLCKKSLQYCILRHSKFFSTPYLSISLTLIFTPIFTKFSANVSKINKQQMKWTRAEIIPLDNFFKKAQERLVACTPPPSQHVRRLTRNCCKIIG